MDTHGMLFQAAHNGKIDVLKKLLKENPTILVDIKLICLEKSLLHVATKSGQLSFVQEFLNIDPDAAKELDRDGFRPLDIAVIVGNLEITKELVNFDDKLVRLKGKDRRTALHYAAMKGRVDIIEELISVCPDCVEDVTVREETAIHLAVKSFQSEAFAVLVKWTERFNKELINMGDEDGNTVIHLAISTKQYMCLDLLLGINSTIRETVEVNTKNGKGLTALDICDIIVQDTYDIKARQILQNAAANRAQDSITKKAENSMQHETNSKRINHDFHSESSKHWFEYFKFQKQRDSPSNTRNALLVVAALIATVTFQAGVNPPNGIFDHPQAPTRNNTNQNSRERPFIGPAGGSALAAASAIFGSRATSFLFLFSNSLGLTASVCIIIYLTAGFPFQRELHISLYSMMFTYGVVIDTIIKGIDTKKKAVAYVLVTVAFVLPFMQRWLPRWGKKAWRKWRKKADRKTFLPLES